MKPQITETFRMLSDALVSNRNENKTTDKFFSEKLPWAKGKSRGQGGGKASENRFSRFFLPPVCRAIYCLGAQEFPLKRFGVRRDKVADEWIMAKNNNIKIYIWYIKNTHVCVRTLVYLRNLYVENLKWKSYIFWYDSLIEKSWHYKTALERKTKSAIHFNFVNFSPEEQ